MRDHDQRNESAAAAASEKKKEKKRYETSFSASFLLSLFSLCDPSFSQLLFLSTIQWNLETWNNLVVVSKE